MEDEYVFCRYITKNGKRIYPKHAKFFKFLAKKKTRQSDESSNS